MVGVIGATRAQASARDVLTGRGSAGAIEPLGPGSSPSQAFFRVLSSTGSPAFFQALKPPSISQTGSSPICWAVSAASAERQAPLQKKTNSLPGAKTSL